MIAMADVKMQDKGLDAYDDELLENEIYWVTKAKQWWSSEIFGFIF